MFIICMYRGLVLGMKNEFRCEKNLNNKGVFSYEEFKNDDH